MLKKRSTEKTRFYASIARKIFSQVERVFRAVIFVSYVYGVVSLVFLLVSGFLKGSLSSITNILGLLSLVLLVGLLLNMYNFSGRMYDIENQMKSFFVVAIIASAISILEDWFTQFNTFSGFENLMMSLTFSIILLGSFTAFIVVDRFDIY